MLTEERRKKEKTKIKSERYFYIKIVNNDKVLNWPRLLIIAGKLLTPSPLRD